MIKVKRFMNSDEMDKEFLGKQLAIRYDDAVSGKNRTYDRAYVLAAYDDNEFHLIADEARRTGVCIAQYAPSNHASIPSVGILEAQGEIVLNSEV